MCLISFSWQPDATYPLTLVANRDEFYERATKSVHFWEDNPNILGGRDLQAGGSWMAVNRQGRFAAVTNYRELPHPTGMLSRGKLVRDFLESELHPRDYLSRIDKQADQFAGFNLLIGSTEGLYYYSNRMKAIITLEPGIYGLCNHLLNTEWPKLSKVKTGMAERLNQDNFASPEALIGLMHDPVRPPEHSLPDTGVGLETEKTTVVVLYCQRKLRHSQHQCFAF